MLNLYIGHRENTIMKASSAFNEYFEKTWLDNNVCKRAIEEIDKCKILSNECLLNQFNEQIPPVYLSGGCKLVITLANTNLQLNLDNAGNNCVKFIEEIARNKDVDCDLSYAMFLTDYKNIRFKNDNYIANSLDDFIEHLTTLLMEDYNEG